MTVVPLTHFQILVEDVDNYTCPYKDVTTEITKGCQDMLTSGRGTCRVALTSLLPDTKQCPECDGEWGIIYRWDCVPGNSGNPLGLQLNYAKRFLGGRLLGRLPARTIPSHLRRAGTRQSP